MPQLPLEGIRVIEIADVWAGPFANTLLADLGAQVIKVESIQRFGSRGLTLKPPPGSPGYPDNDPGERPWNRSATYNGINRNKLGLTLDLSRPKGVEVCKRLARVSDILIENYAAGIIARLGLGYEALKEINPGIIVISMPLFGNTGPYGNYRGWGSSADPLVGHAWIRGYPDSDPSTTSSNVFHTDAVSAATAAFAACTALYYRKRTGKGQYIDVSQAETFMPHLGEFYMEYIMNEQDPKPMGNRHPFMSPHGCYQCAGEDRWVVIAVSSDEEWEGLCRAMGNPAWAQDEKFSDTLSRWKNQDELDRHIAEWAAERDHYEIMHLLQKEGVSAGPVLDNGDIYADPHLEERRFFEEVTHKDAGTHTDPGVLWKLSKTPMSIRLPANCLGEHNEYILGEILGLSGEEISELEKEQIIGKAYLPDAEAARERPPRER
ncbi:MAG: CoA transferase [Candidatus Tectomicrobia bacterium]|nr:CoA transferase [Candidatus Tectomicrobia bacterium]